MTVANESLLMESHKGSCQVELGQGARDELSKDWNGFCDSQQMYTIPRPKKENVWWSVNRKVYEHSGLKKKKKKPNGEVKRK